MHDEKTFLQAIAERPHDESCRLVFADWLEEAGDPRAEFLRVDAELAQMPPGDPARGELQLRWRDLRDELPREWQTLLSRSPVENCGLKLHPCPQRWSDLNGTPQEGVRHCWACEQAVHYCRSIEELREHARRGECVAIDPATPHLPQDLLPVEDVGDSLSLGVIAFDDGPAGEPSRLWRAARRPR